MYFLKNQKNYPAKSEMENFMSKYFGDEFFSYPESREAYAPKLSIRETDKEYFVHAEMPGVKENDIKVSLKDNTLILEGEKKNEYKKVEGERWYEERTYGSFYRQIPFTKDLDNEKVNATMKDGMLDIVLMKKTGVYQGIRKIDIKKT